MTANINNVSADTAVEVEVEADAVDTSVAELNFKDFKMPPRKIMCSSCYSYKSTEYNVSVNEKYESCKKTFVFDDSKKQIIIINQINGNIIKHKYINEEIVKSNQGGISIIYTLKNKTKITLHEDHISMIIDNYNYVFNYDKHTPSCSYNR